MFVRLYKTHLIANGKHDGLGSDIRVEALNYKINSNAIIGIEEFVHTYNGKNYYTVVFDISSMFDRLYRDNYLIDEKSYKALMAERN